MVKLESFLICIWLPLTEFTDYSESVLSIIGCFPTSLVYIITQE